MTQNATQTEPDSIYVKTFKRQQLGIKSIEDLVGFLLELFQIPYILYM